MRQVLAIVLLCAFVSAASAEESLDEFEARIARTWKSVNSLSYDIETSMVTDDDGKLRISKVLGSVELQRSGDKWKVRSENKAMSASKPGNVSSRMESVEVFDGVWLYSLTLTDDGKKKCAKMKVHDSWSETYDSATTIKQLKKACELTLEREDAVDGQPVIVIKAEPKSLKASKGRHFFNKESGMWLGHEWKSEDGKTTSKVRIKNIKMNPDIKVERFAFAAPPGVEIEDMTHLIKSGANK